MLTYKILFGIILVSLAAYLIFKSKELLTGEGHPLLTAFLVVVIVASGFKIGAMAISDTTAFIDNAIGSALGEITSEMENMLR